MSKEPDSVIQIYSYLLRVSKLVKERLQHHDASDSSSSSCISMCQLSPEAQESTKPQGLTSIPIQDIKHAFLEKLIHH